MSVLYGLALGALVGIERERSTSKDDKQSFAGVRTFSLIGLIGSLAGMFYDNYIFVSALIGIGVVLLVTSAYFISHSGKKSYGITSEVAALTILGVGFLCGIQEYILGSVISVILVLVLGLKEYIHYFAKSMTEDELWSLIKFVIISVVVLPLLPREAVDPWGLFVPYNVWFLVVLIAGISALSYVGIKVIGYRKGLSLSGFLGGLVSSTAVTLSFSKMSKDLPKKFLSPVLFAILIASAAMYYRILFQVVVVNQDMFLPLSVPLLFGGTWLMGWSFYFYNDDCKSEDLSVDKIGIKNPVDLSSAVKFGALFVFILALTKYANTMLGETGLLIASGLSGFVDTDAISLSLASLANSSITTETASLGVIIATTSNMLTKLVFVSLVAAEAVRKKFTLVVGVNMVLIGLIGVWWVL